MRELSLFYTAEGFIMKVVKHVYLILTLIFFEIFLIENKYFYYNGYLALAIVPIISFLICLYIHGSEKMKK